MSSEILGIGATHFPPALGPHERYSMVLKLLLEKSPRIPQHMKDPGSWPEDMQAEYRKEGETTKRHQAQLVEGFRTVRAAIDEFQPDVVIIFGDDQYENFQEELVPPFCVAIQEEFTSKPFAPEVFAKGNPWGASADQVFHYPGAAETARDIVHALSETCDFPVAYSRTPLHHDGLSHAFGNLLVYLDWNQNNPWRYPLIPIAVNAYGRDLHRTKGLFAHLLDTRQELGWTAPGGPTPAACFRLGQNIRAVLETINLRIAVIASSSWSHAFLTEKNHWLWPDIEADRARFDELKAGEQRGWASLSNKDIYDSGHHEFRNWICLAGVFPDRTPQVLDYIETWTCNSDKCFAVL